MCNATTHESLWPMSHNETPHSKQKGVLTRARAKREQEGEVWEPRPKMGMLEQEGEEVGGRQAPVEQQRGREADD
ncbi:unnamed protein product [Arctia plantaginis]|uniref:Uncharacterized protein n=1 Tax=Arctia plantaginis TaxID=874455 RepID=A0A8S0ZJH2_ARCPL|nr:unnamed protein product [Arctia plantaginis]